MLQLSLVNFKKDSYILVEGKSCGDKFYIIRSGTVNCYSQKNCSSYQLGPGDFIGVIPCMSGHEQSETVVASSDVVAIAVRRDQYSELIQQNTPVALKIIRTFANKMRIMNEHLTRLALNNTTDLSPNQIYRVGSFYESAGNIDAAVYAYYQYLKAWSSGPYAESAKKHFIAYKKRSNAVYFEPNQDLYRRYPKGTMIFSECQSGQDMFIIQSGQVKITKIVNKNEVILAVLKKGDFFGEMALLENKPRSACAIAFEDCQLMVVNRQNFDQMVSSQPQLVSRLTITLAERIWGMERQLENASIQNPINKMLDMLALQLEKEKIEILHGRKTTHQFNFTAEDLANMCGISHDIRWTVIQQFLENPLIKIMENKKLFVLDCLEIIKTASFYRKQNNT